MNALLEYFLDNIKQEILDEASATYKAMVSAAKKKRALHRKTSKTIDKTFDLSRKLEKAKRMRK